MCHEETLEESDFWSVCSPYHLDGERGGLRKVSLANPPASDPLEGYPSDRVKLRLESFLHSHYSVGILIDTLPGVIALGPAKGLSSAVAVELSTSGIWVQPI